MTSADWWRVGARLLGVYFVVLAGIYAATAIAAFGVTLPEGSNVFAFASTPVIQALVTGSAGVWLIRRAGPEESRSGVGSSSGAFVAALQLLGIFFLVSGASELAHVLVDSAITTTPWELRSAQLTSGAVDAAAGAALTFAPLQVAGFLGRFAGQ